MGRKLLPEEIQECREQGLLGSLVADQNYRASLGGLYPDGVEDFDKLHGPRCPRPHRGRLASNGGEWKDIEELETIHDADAILDPCNAPDEKWEIERECIMRTGQVRDNEFFDLITTSMINRKEDQLVDTNAKFPHWAGKEVYFEALDALRNLIYRCRTMGELYWCGDACVTLDNFMEREVEGWKTVTPADVRLERAFAKVEARVRKTMLVKMDTIKVSRKETVTV